MVSDREWQPFTVQTIGKVTSFTEAGQRPLFPALINKL